MKADFCNNSNLVLLLFALSSLALLPSLAEAQCQNIVTTPISNSTVSMNGLSLTFDKAYTMGQFANGIIFADPLPILIQDNFDPFYYFKIRRY